MTLKVYCVTCGQHIWDMDKPPELGTPMRTEIFTGGPHPPPANGTYIATSCPACKGMPLVRYGSNYWVRTNHGDLPKEG